MARLRSNTLVKSRPQADRGGRLIVYRQIIENLIATCSRFACVVGTQIFLEMPMYDAPKNGHCFDWELSEIYRCRNRCSKFASNNEGCELVRATKLSSSILHRFSELFRTLIRSKRVRDIENVQPLHSKCRACQSECNNFSFSCEICGEPRIISSTKFKKKKLRPKTFLHNQLCGTCGAYFSSLEKLCPICETESQFACSTIPEEPPQCNE